MKKYLLFIISLMGCGHHNKPNPRIAESNAYYKKLDAQVAAFPNELATGKYDSMMLTDTNYYLIKGGISAGEYVWDMSNRLRHLLDSMYKRKADNQPHIGWQAGGPDDPGNPINQVREYQGGFGPSPLPFKTKPMPISMGAAPLHYDTSFGISEYGECALCETPQEQIDDLYKKVTELQNRMNSVMKNKKAMTTNLTGEGSAVVGASAKTNDNRNLGGPEYPLPTAQEALETFRRNMEAEGLFTKKIKAIWDRQYNYLKNYQINH